MLAITPPMTTLLKDYESRNAKKYTNSIAHPTISTYVIENCQQSVCLRDHLQFKYLSIVLNTQTQHLLRSSLSN